MMWFSQTRSNNGVLISVRSDWKQIDYVIKEADLFCVNHKLLVFFCKCALNDFAR